MLRERRTEQNAQMREGMKTGDERYLPQRDKGPVKRFIRDFVDSRLTWWSSCSRCSSRSG